MKRLAFLAALPVVAFMAVYSLDVGCFICLYGEERGGAAEKWINGALVAALIALVITQLWRRRQ